MIKMNFEKEFKKCTVRRKLKDGFSINCKKGLWSVTSPDKEFAENEARRYFVLYQEDGEYNEFIY